MSARLILALAGLLLGFLGPLSTRAVAQAQPTAELMRAAARGDAAAIPRLIAAGADPNAGFDPDTGRTSAPPFEEIDYASALSISVYCGCPDVARALLAGGAVPTTVDFAWAIGLNQPELARAMLPGFSTPEHRSLPVIARLVRRMPAEASQVFRGVLVQQILTGRMPPGADRIVWIQLFAQDHVTSAGDPIFALLDDLIAAGFPIDATSDDDDGAATARELASRAGDVLLARGLARRGAALPTGWSEAREREIQLVGAAAADNPQGVDLLLAERVALDAADPQGRHAMAQAAAAGDFGLAQRLLAAGASPRASGAGEPSPLVSATRADRSDYVEALLKAGAPPDAVDGTGEFPLRVAARHGALKSLAALLAHGAAPGALDARGRTALHALIEPDDGASTNILGARRERPIGPLHLEAAKALAAAGLPMRTVDADGVSVLGSNLGAHPADAQLIATLLDSGAVPSDGDLDQALGRKDPELLRMMLARRDATPLPSAMLEAAMSRVVEELDLATALLEHGVQLPREPDERVRLLAHAAAAPSDAVLGLLIGAGIKASADAGNEAMESAIRAGRPANVLLLVGQGADVNLRDAYQRTVLHRVVGEDARSSGASALGAAQRAAITAVLDSGFALGALDRDGRTVSAVAARRQATAQAFGAAVAAAGATAQGIHGAIRRGDDAALLRLAADPAARESRDALGRTPLSLALQIRDWRAARVLLRAGATIAQVPASAWQPADTDFAGEPAIASAFAVRMLAQTLVAIPAERDQPSLLAMRGAYAAGRLPPVGDFSWNLNCRAPRVKCGAGVVLAGNRKVIDDLVESWRIDRGASTSFGLTQRNLRSIHPTGSIDLGHGPVNLDFGEITFLVNGALTIGACAFDFSRPTCSPGIRLENPNVASGLSMLTDTGYEELPTATMRFVQVDGASGVLAPGESVILDRSAGEVRVTLDDLTARVFALRVNVERLAGEEVLPLPAERSTANRMALYARLSRLRAAREGQASSPAARAADKTLASTIRALSAEAYLADYPGVVLELLRQQAQVVARLDLQVRAIQNAVLAQASYTPAQIDVLVARIDAALADGTTTDPAILREIRGQLVQLRRSAEATGSAVNVLRQTLFTDADLFIELYQALVLEYRQYVPSDALDAAITPEDRIQLLRRIGPQDVVIPDAAAGGTGQSLRRAFGLPDPVK